MTKKGISIIACILIVLTIFAGCNTVTTSGEETSAPETKETVATEQKTESPTEEPVPEIVDLNWILSVDYSGFPDTERVAEYIAEQSGVRVVPIFADSSAGGSVQKFNLMVASGEDVDVVGLSLNDFTLALQNGVIQPITESWEKYGENLQKYIDSGLTEWLISKEDGELYGVANESTNCPAAVTIRTDWLEMLNLDMPTSIDELESVMIAMRDTLDVNPMGMSIVISWPRSFDEALGGMFLPMGYSWYKGEDGTYLPPEMHPEYKAFISKLHDWYVEGLINPETFSDAYKPLIKANEIGVTAGSYGDGFQADLLNIEPNAWYEAIQGIGVGSLAQMIPASSIKVINVNSDKTKVDGQ